MENKEKQPLVQVKHLCKYFKVGRHAELKAGNLQQDDA